MRLALGARRRDIVAELLRGGGALIATGTALGLAGALAVTRLLRSLLHGVEPGDPAVLAGATLGLVALALFATLVPARRASRLDPAEILRHD